MDSLRRENRGRVDRDVIHAPVSCIDLKKIRSEKEMPALHHRRSLLDKGILLTITWGDGVSNVLNDAGFKVMDVSQSGTAWKHRHSICPYCMYSNTVQYEHDLQCTLYLFLFYMNILNI